MMYLIFGLCLFSLVILFIGIDVICKNQGLIIESQIKILKELKTKNNEE